MDQVPLLSRDMEYMKEQFLEMKSNVTSEFTDVKSTISSLNCKVENIVPQITQVLEDKYVRKENFENYKEKVDKVVNIGIYVGGCILLAVLYAVLKLVIKE